MHRYCLEHGLNFDGRPNPEAKLEDVGSLDPFFTESNGKFVPRSIFVDLDPSPLDEIQHGSYKELFHPDLMVKGKEDAASNYARGHYTVGKELVDKVLEKIRRVAGNFTAVQMVLSLTGSRQLELPARLPCLQLFWWWYRIGIWRSSARTVVT